LLVSDKATALIRKELNLNANELGLQELVNSIKATFAA
jgi:hypothetical protein